MKLNRNGKLSGISRFSSQKITGSNIKKDAKDFLDIVEKAIAFSRVTRPADPGNVQVAYDNRQQALFGSTLIGTAAQCYQRLAVGLPWNDISDQFIDRFLDDKSNRSGRIETGDWKPKKNNLMKISKATYTD